MSKRAASVQLTSDNYEEDEITCDQPGRFEEASEEELKNRVIKRAARRTNTGGSGREGGLFAGFKMTATASGSAGFLGRRPLSTATQTITAPEDGENVEVLSTGSASSNGGTEYLVQLRALNVGVSQWISTHVEKNPHVDLTPIFRDYEKHLKTIDIKYKPVMSDQEGSQETEGSEGSQETEESSQDVDSVDTCSQVTTETDADPSTTGEHVRGSQEQPSIAPSSQDSVPDDSLFAVRAKLFYKKAEEFNELGIGTLKVQSSNGQSVRLLLRNDTSIGNILMNVKLTSNVPMTRNKNNLMIVCQANPPLGKDTDDKAVTYLIRVKTEELAAHLHTVIKDNVM